jgi:isopenicillin N synthase-like dioxygenase
MLYALEKSQGLNITQVHHTGFFSVIGTGFTQEEIDRQYDIGQAYLNLPIEEKGDPKHRCNFAEGNYYGYRVSAYPRTSLSLI